MICLSRVSRQTYPRSTQPLRPPLTRLTPPIAAPPNPIPPPLPLSAPPQPPVPHQQAPAPQYAMHPMFEQYALYGLAGQAVRTLAPHTEAQPEARHKARRRWQKRLPTLSRLHSFPPREHEFPWCVSATIARLVFGNREELAAHNTHNADRFQRRFAVISLRARPVFTRGAKPRRNTERNLLLTSGVDHPVPMPLARHEDKRDRPKGTVKLER